MGKRIYNVRSPASLQGEPNGLRNSPVKTLTLQTNTNITVNWFRYHIPPVDSISSKTCAATTLAHMGASKVLQ